MGRLDDKVVLITGASRGIGAACARAASAEGARVILADIRVEEGQALAKELGGAFFEMDVSQEAAWAKFSSWVSEHYGRLDALVNNAGITGIGEDWGSQDPEHSTLESWHAVHRVNLDGVFLGCKYGIALMKASGGSIINMSSRSGMVGIPAASAYASSKAAVRNHSKTVALYCAQEGYKIRCNSVHPGAILTPLWEPMFGGSGTDREAAIQAVGQGVPLGHMGEPMDVAHAVVYLASDESKYLTGIELTIDGGILAGSTAAPKQG